MTNSAINLKLDALHDQQRSLEQQLAALALEIKRVEALALSFSIDEIMRRIATHFRIEADQLISNRRDQFLTYPRFVGIYFARKLTRESFPEIGKVFRRDHSSVIHAYRIIERRAERESAFARTLLALEAKLFSSASAEQQSAAVAALVEQSSSASARAEPPPC